MRRTNSNLVLRYDVLPYYGGGTLSCAKEILLVGSTTDHDIVFGLREDDVGTLYYSCFTTFAYKYATPALKISDVVKNMTRHAVLLPNNNIFA